MFRAQNSGRSTVRPRWPPFVRTNFRFAGHFNPTRITSHLEKHTHTPTGCLPPCTKSFPKIRLGSKGNTTCQVVSVKNSREQRKVWKGSPVSTVGMFQKQIRVPFLESLLSYQFQAFAAVLGCMELICTNGKRDSGTKFTKYIYFCPCK